MSAYEIGKYYRVPCVRARYCGIDGEWPVVWPAHEDAEHIGFDQWHYHVDVRFVDKHVFRAICRRKPHHGEHFARHFPLMCHEGTDLLFSRADIPTPAIKRRMCSRQWTYSAMQERAPWKTALEGAYRDAKLVRGHCPHRAADLSTLPVDEHGCVECPLHGLVWHVETGRMVPRAEWNRMRSEAAS